MNPKPNHSLRLIAHPYLFVLKEGKKIVDDPLDYSLMILFIHSNEIIKSPPTTTLGNVSNNSKKSIAKRLERESPFSL